MIAAKSHKGALFLEFHGCTWAEVDLSALLHNFSVVRQLYGRERKLLSIVKTDAYGHGAVPVARALQDAGSEGFCVSSLPEADQLRRCGITVPILILGYTPTHLVPQLAEKHIHQCVYALDYARELDAAAQAAGVRICTHLKLDTGMGRLGFDCRSDAEPGLQEALQVLQLKNLDTTGVFMHFATADGTSEEDTAFAQAQADRFTQAVAALQATGHQFTYIHCCNSAGTLSLPALGNAIRPGIILYGLSPMEYPIPQLQPVMSLYSTVSMVKTLSGGQTLSYGRTYTAQADRKIATVCAGYGDGVPRLLSGRGHVLIRGKRAPIVGRICMDHLCVDVTDIEGVCRGDTVTLFGPGLPVQEVARQAQTIHYEILCGITKRVQRIYK